ISLGNVDKADMYIVQDVTFPVWANMVFLNLSTDCLGSIVFARVKSDIAGSITVKNQGENELYGAGWPKMGATLALMWLKRSDKLVAIIQVMSPSLRSNSQLSVFAAPYKADFLRALSKRSRKRTAGTKYDFLVNFTATDAIYEMYTKMNAEI
uniref:Uncharacterized protein n=1 Tax=Oncorhynchus mykiss TaxID=8022 RepID=A0A8C7VCW5_ONCMY